MRDLDTDRPESEDDMPIPTREPTTWEKWSILLVAIVAFAGIAIMCLVVVGLVIARGS